MSHVATVDLKITDLTALETAVKRLGGELVRNQKTYNWWGRSEGDYPIPEGMTAEDLGKCEHVIRVPGVRYEIGIVKNKKAPGYILAYDFFGWGDGRDATGNVPDGAKLHEQFGEGLTKLKQGYAVARAEIAARAKGLSVQKQTLKDGTIKLVLTGASL